MFRCSKTTKIKAVAGLLGAVVALTACGPLKVGSAAIVGDERIPTSELDQAVQDWKREFSGNAQANRLRQQVGLPGAPGAEISESDVRNALSLLVLFEVGEEVAKAQRLNVTQAETDKVLAQGLGGREAADVRTLASGLPTRYTPDFVKFMTTQTLLLQRYGYNPGNPDPRAQQQTDQALRQAVDRLGIDINPRFGAFDPRQGAVGPARTLLSAPQTGTGTRPGTEPGTEPGHEPGGEQIDPAMQAG